MTTDILMAVLMVAQKDSNWVAMKVVQLAVDLVELKVVPSESAKAVQ